MSPPPPPPPPPPPSRPDDRVITRYQSIAEYRTAHALSQRQLAEQLGISQSALSMIESGARTPRPELALKIHAVTRVPLKRLLATKPARLAEPPKTDPTL